MQLNFRRIFVNTEILRTSDYLNIKTYMKILHQTAEGGGGVVKHHLKHTKRKKWRV